MQAHSRDRNRVYSIMKKARGASKSSLTTKLDTPVGTFFGQDVLEGFTADAEYLGRAEGEGPDYDNHFYRMCMEENQCILEFYGEESVSIPPMTMRGWRGKKSVRF